jgi:hypothetical protein
VPWHSAGQLLFAGDDNEDPGPVELELNAAAIAADARVAAADAAWREHNREELARFYASQGTRRIRRPRESASWPEDAGATVVAPDALRCAHC